MIFQMRSSGKKGRTAAHDEDLNLKNIEKKAIFQALQKAGGNKSEAAKLLGVNTTTVYRKMAKYNIADSGLR